VLKLLVVQTCETADVPFEGVHALNRSTKREIFEWIGENWDALGETFIIIAANQPIVSARSCGWFTQRKGPSDEIKRIFGFLSLA
jgi:hypothetical protein